MSNIYNGDIIEVDGISFNVALPYDDSGLVPWEYCDGHGPVSEWTTREKRPGEMILHNGRTGRRYYDFAEACKIALRDGWGSPGDDGLSPKAKAAKAAMADFNYLRRWCNDQWHYIGVSVTMLDNDGDALPYESSTIWGIESDCGEYIEETAIMLARELIAELESNLAA